MFYSRRQLQSVSQGQTTPEDPQSSPVASSDSGSLSQVRRSSQVSYPVEGFFSYLMNRFPHRAYLMSVQSSHEPESFAEAFNHSCWREPISFLKSARAKDTGRYNYTYTTIK